MNRLSAIGLVACAGLAATMIAMTVVSDAADAQWHSLFGTLVREVAQAFTPPPSWNRAGTERAQLSVQLYTWGHALACVVFTLLFWARATPTPRRPAWVDAGLLALQLLIGVTVETHLLFVFAAELALVAAPRAAAGWLAALVLAHLAQSLAILRALVGSDQVARYVLLEVGLDTLFFLFAFAVATLAVLEQRARLKLAASHAQLQATQALLADAVRATERLRIARDLHDSIGHHLTALNLHLDLAERQLAGGNDALRTARGLSQDLLAEVRAVVSAERSDQAIDLRQSLRALCEGIPSPAISLEMADDLRIGSAFAAHALLHCIQEALSNALRHAGATRVWVVLERRAAGLAATIRDDGHGARGRPEGNGLTGMRERLQALGGRLVAGDLASGGFQVELSLPAPGAAS